MSDDKAAEAAAADAAGSPRELTFGEGDDAVTLTIPRKWKRFKFMRALNRGDIGAALEAIWQPVKGDDGEPADHPALLQLDELDVDETQFNATLEKLAEALGGTDSGNSSASRA